MGLPLVMPNIAGDEHFVRQNIQHLTKDDMLMPGEALTRSIRDQAPIPAELSFAIWRARIDQSVHRLYR